MLGISPDPFGLVPLLIEDERSRLARLPPEIDPLSELFLEAYPGRASVRDLYTGADLDFRTADLHVDRDDPAAPCLVLVVGLRDGRERQSRASALVRAEGLVVPATVGEPEDGVFDGGFKDFAWACDLRREALGRDLTLLDVYGVFGAMGYSKDV